MYSLLIDVLTNQQGWDHHVLFWFLPVVRCIFILTRVILTSTVPYVHTNTYWCRYKGLMDRNTCDEMNHHEGWHEKYSYLCDKWHVVHVPSVISLCVFHHPLYFIVETLSGVTLVSASLHFLLCVVLFLQFFYINSVLYFFLFSLWRQKVVLYTFNTVTYVCIFS